MASPHSAFLTTRRFTSLDGLRCLAILPVIWHHSTPRPLEGVLGKGPLGVHLFFVISGFLITTLLLRERRSYGGISIPHFFMRRSLRIFPLYYAVLALYTVRAVWFLPSSPMRTHFLGNLPYFASYTTNWFVDFGVPHPVIFGFSWSLSTEEQFYLLWPFLLVASRSWRGPVLFVIALLALDAAAEHGLLSAVLVADGVPLRIVTSISTPICLGALLACALDAPRSFGVSFLALGHRMAAPIALAALGAFLWWDAPLLMIHFAMTALVGAVCVRPDHGLRGLLEVRPIRRVGVVSYGIYLFHVSVITFIKKSLPFAKNSPASIFAFATLLTILLATISYRYFERPLLNLRERFGAAALRSAQGRS